MLARVTDASWGMPSIFRAFKESPSRRAWATVCSLIATAKLNNVEPFAYLKDVLERMTVAHPMNRLDDLLPWNWAKMPVNQ